MMMMMASFDGHCYDVTAPEAIEIVISDNVIWINNEERCLFRACKIKNIILQDNRIGPVPEEIVISQYRDQVPKIIEQSLTQNLKPSQVVGGLEVIRKINDAEPNQDG